MNWGQFKDLLYNEVVKVMFSQACVCPRGGVPGPGGGACSWGGVCSWGWSRGVSVPGGVCSEGCLLCGGVCSGGCLLWGVCLGGGLVPGCGAWSGYLVLGGLVSHHALRQTPPGETTTAADGTHPTGMHSCLIIDLFIKSYPTENHCKGNSKSRLL